jgi:membrane protein DedA with SNARE-associated domain
MKWPSRKPRFSVEVLWLTMPSILVKTGERSIAMLTSLFLSKSAAVSLLSGLLEGAGIPWPGGIVLTAAGVQYAGLPATLLFGTLFAVAYTAAAALQYLIGRCCGTLIARTLPPATRSRMDSLIRRYGQVAVLWTRPLAIGNYISIPAGMMRMHPGRFLAYTFLGIWPWAVGMAMAGSWLGNLLGVLTVTLPLLAAAVVAITLMLGAYKLWVRAHANRRATSFGD